MTHLVFVTNPNLTNDLIEYYDTDLGLLSSEELNYHQQRAKITIKSSITVDYNFGDSIDGIDYIEHQVNLYKQGLIKKPIWLL